jgi:hypothetical protein
LVFLVPLSRFWLKALVFLDKEEQVKAEGVPGLSGVVTSLSQLQDSDFQEKVSVY